MERDVHEAKCMHGILESQPCRECDPRHYYENHDQVVARLRAELGAARARVGLVAEWLTVPHLLEAANKRVDDRDCEREGVKDGGDICLDACESMADFCDPCLIAQLVGTIEDAARATRPREGGGAS